VAARQHEFQELAEGFDECFCCEDVFRETQLDDDGLCTMCADARRSYNRDGIPAGRPCCRKTLTVLKKRGERA
jgi:hypothetical protein